MSEFGKYDIYPIIDVWKDHKGIQTLIDGRKQYMDYHWEVYVDDNFIGCIGFRKQQSEFEKLLLSMLKTSQVSGKKQIDIYVPTGCVIARYKIIHTNGIMELEYITGRWSIGGIIRP